MGGSERLIHNLALRLDRQVFNPSVAYFYGEEILKEFSDLKIPLHLVPKVKRFDLSTIRKLGDIIKENNIHIVNAHHFMPVIYSLYGTKPANSGKLFCTFHSEWEIESLPLKWRIIGNLLLKRTEGVIAVSKEVAGSVEKTLRLHRSKIFTIHNGVDVEGFSKKNGKSDLRKELGLVENEKVIGMVANFKTVKNHFFLLRAFNELIKENKNVKLLLIGRGFNDPDNTEREIRHFIMKNGLTDKVMLLGYRSDVPKLLNVLDIFCLTSFKEGLPIGLIEAMASGLPVVGTNVEGIRGVIRPNKNGFIVELNDTEGLKGVLSVLLNNDKQRHLFGQESRSLAITQYGLQNCISQYQGLFLSACKKNTGNSRRQASYNQLADQ